MNKLKNPTIGICGLAYKKNTNLTTKSPGMQLFNYFKKRYQTITYDEMKPDKNVDQFEKNIEAFAKKSDVIFLCYPNNIFKKLERINYSKKTLVIDLWNFLKIKNKKVKLKIVGIS